MQTLTNEFIGQCKLCWRSGSFEDPGAIICRVCESDGLLWHNNVRAITNHVRPLMWSMFPSCEIHENATVDGVRLNGTQIVFDIVIPEYRLAIDFTSNRPCFPGNLQDTVDRTNLDNAKETLTRANNYRWISLSDDLGEARNKLLECINEIYVLQTSNTSQLLTPKLQGDAGWDIVCDADCVCPAQQGTDIPSDLFVEIPNQLYGIVQARSSTSKKRLLVLPGVIDPAYRGRIYVMAYNLTNEPIVIKKGDRIAQMLFFYRIPHLHIQLVKQLRTSERGARGFGSTDT